MKRWVCILVAVLLAGIGAVQAERTWVSVTNESIRQEAAYIEKFNEHYEKYGGFTEMDGIRLCYHIKLYFTYKAQKEVEANNELFEMTWTVPNDAKLRALFVQKGNLAITRALDDQMLKYLDGEVTYKEFEKELVKYLDATMAGINSSK